MHHLYHYYVNFFLVSELSAILFVLLSKQNRDFICFYFSTRKRNNFFWYSICRKEKLAEFHFFCFYLFCQCQRIFFVLCWMSIGLWIWITNLSDMILDWIEYWCERWVNLTFMRYFTGKKDGGKEPLETKEALDKGFVDWRTLN